MKVKKRLKIALLLAVLLLSSSCYNAEKDAGAFNSLEVKAKNDIAISSTSKAEAKLEITNSSTLEGTTEAVTFEISAIPDDVFESMQGKSYPVDCKVPREDLKYLQMSYVDFEGETQVGEMVVNQAIAEDVIDIFKQLYDASYPIEKMKLIDEYDAVDEKSMEDNNTSAFCFRYISNTTRFSKHAKGMAVDINPLYNPYVKEGGVEPKAAEVYLDRTKDVPYYISEDDLATKLFKEKGFTWGGNFEGRIDYQHFEMPNRLYQEVLG